MGYVSNEMIPAHYAAMAARDRRYGGYFIADDDEFFEADGITPIKTELEEWREDRERIAGENQS